MCDEETIYRVLCLYQRPVLRGARRRTVPERSAWQAAATFLSKEKNVQAYIELCARTCGMRRRLWALLCDSMRIRRRNSGSSIANMIIALSEVKRPESRQH